MVGGDCNKFKVALRGVHKIYATWIAFAVDLKDVVNCKVMDGSVMTCGSKDPGGDWWL